jgi:hypothetical protein
MDEKDFGSITAAATTGPHHNLYRPHQYHILNLGQEDVGA